MKRFMPAPPMKRARQQRLIDELKQALQIKTSDKSLSPITSSEYAASLSKTGKMAYLARFNLSGFKYRHHDT